MCHIVFITQDNQPPVANCHGNSLENYPGKRDECGGL